MLQDNVRRTILKALFSDAMLYDHLVLKGGNALALVYQIGDRSSLDLDFSMHDDFADIASMASRIERVLTQAFHSEGIDVLDFSVTRKPTRNTKPWWGGYLVEFKLLPSGVAAELGNDPVKMSRQAMTIGPGSQRRKYRVEISKHEFVDGSTSARVDDVNVRVYSPALIAAEKLRALLQQHPDYPQVPSGMKRSGSRDLYDISAISHHFALRLQEHYSLVEAVFAAKRVSMSLLSRFEELRTLHQGDWTDVELSVSREIDDFDSYFSFVAKIATDLHAKWVENTP